MDIDDYGFIEDDDGEEGLLQTNDDDRCVDIDSLLALYKEGTPDLEQYLASTDYSSSPPNDLAKLQCESLDRRNEKIATAHGTQYKISYTLLKQYQYEVQELKRQIEATSGASKTKLTNDLHTTFAQIHKYLVNGNLPTRWANLLGAPPPPESFDSSLPSAWDRLYNGFPRKTNDQYDFHSLGRTTRAPARKNLGYDALRS